MKPFQICIKFFLQQQLVEPLRLDWFVQMHKSLGGLIEMSMIYSWSFDDLLLKPWVPSAELGYRYLN